MASTYLSRTFGTPTDNNKWTFSAWVKRSDISAGQMLFYAINGTNKSFVRFDDDDTLTLLNAISGSTDSQLNTTRKFRDTSAFFHIVAVFDSSNVTSADRQILYVNGLRETAFGTNTESSTDAVSTINSAVAHNIGAQSSNLYFDGNMTHIHFTDGYAYDADTFGETDATTGIWKPKTAPSVTYGTNGFFLKFENSGSMGTDSSGNANNFTVNGSLTQTVSTPSNVFCVNNVLSLSASGVTNANGNLSVTSNASSGWRDLFGTFGASQGKWYWEQKIDNYATGLNPHYIGICDESYFNNSATGTNFENSGVPRAYGYTKTGDKINASSVTSYGDSWTTGDIIGIAVDLDNGKIYFSKNGTWQNSGDPTSGATGTGSAFNVTTGYTYLPLTATYYNDNRYSYNFGNGYFGTTAVSSATSDESGLGIFEYTVPSGYYALCTKNINEQEYD
jgi:hypothetical protein